MRNPNKTLYSITQGQKYFSLMFWNLMAMFKVTTVVKVIFLYIFIMFNRKKEIPLQMTERHRFKLTKIKNVISYTFCYFLI